MDAVTVISTIMTFLAGVPYIGPVISVIVGIALPLAAVATSLVAVWHGLVILIQAVALMLTAIGALPKLGALQNVGQKLAAVADKMKADEDVISGEVAGTVVPFLNRLSVISLPKKAA